MKIRILDEGLYPDETNVGFGPKRPGDAGIDLRARETTTVVVGQTCVIPLGVALELPEGTVGWSTGRSSSAIAMGLLVHEGKIDSGYRGEIHVVCTAINREVTVQRGERIVQLVVLKIADPVEWELTDRLTETVRGLMGLGSTGRV